MNQKILEIWEIHRTSKFPSGYGGEVIDGIDLVLLETYVAGCVFTFIQNGGRLDIWRTAILGRCYRDLSVLINHLSGEAKKYFSRLEIISNLILKDIILAEKVHQE
jgi:hypothetical protein